MHDARPRHADVYDLLRLAHAVERARHEGVVLHGVAEHHELRAAEAAVRGGQLRGALDGLTHERNRVHVYTGLGGADVHRRADKLGRSQRLRYGGYQLSVRLGHTLLHQRREAADEVHARGLRGSVERGGKGDVILRLRRGGDKRHRRHGDALIDYRDAEFPLYLLARSDELFRTARDLVVYLPAGGLRVGIGAGQQRYPHRYGADIEMLLVYHVYGFKNVTAIQHGAPLRSCAWR